MDDLTRRRLERNEAVFRAANEEIDERSGPGGVVRYVCECAAAECAETVPLAHAAYAAVRSSPHRYLVVPGHERPELERVVERHERYLVVDKG